MSMAPGICFRLSATESNRASLFQEVSKMLAALAESRFSRPWNLAFIFLLAVAGCCKQASPAGDTASAPAGKLGEGGNGDDNAPLLRDYTLPVASLAFSPDG